MTTPLELILKFVNEEHSKIYRDFHRNVWDLESKLIHENHHGTEASISIAKGALNDLQNKYLRDGMRFMTGLRELVQDFVDLEHNTKLAMEPRWPEILAELERLKAVALIPGKVNWDALPRTANYNKRDYSFTPLVIEWGKANGYKVHQACFSMYFE